ncbi:MAG: HAD-IA family hydrolase [Clostridia bacterium]|nr:HAD-IA family hydrolase [Clostridia bacterium]
MKYEAIIFDLDGTLTDTLGDLTNSVNFALRQFGFPERTHEEVKSFVGNGVRRLIYLSVPENTDEETSERCLSVFKEYYKNNSLVETKPYNGIIPMLESLKKQEIKTAVVTNKMHEAAEEIVRIFFGNLIDITLGQVDGVAQKPQPDGIYHVLEKFGVSKEKAVYVGDSEVDCITAKNAGIPCIGVTWGFRDKSVLIENGADYIADTPEDIIVFTDYIKSRLFEIRDLKYRDFHSRLMPTVEKSKVIGVRTPELRKFAKEISGTAVAESFIEKLPHKYYEENNLHAFLIEKIKDYDKCIEEVNRFLPYIDNWATCDMMRPKIFKKHLPELLAEIEKWLKSEHTYTVRFGIECLMCYCLDDNFSPEYPETVSAIRTDEYYIKMMQAWYFATALAKRYDDILPFIEQNTLDAETHNKTIRKAVESFRITEEQKSYLRKLKR